MLKKQGWPEIYLPKRWGKAAILSVEHRVIESKGSGDWAETYAVVELENGDRFATWSTWSSGTTRFLGNPRELAIWDGHNPGACSCPGGC